MFIDGKRSGYGTLKYKDGSKYRGNWKDDKKNGFGFFMDKNRVKRKGYWTEDKLEHWINQDGSTKN